MIVADETAAWSEQPLELVECDLGTYFQTPSVDCGCPEALFSHREAGVYCVVHFEEDGEGEIFIENADGASVEHSVSEKTLDALVHRAVDIIERTIT